MSFVVNFHDFIPPARYDNVSWAEVQIEEAVASIGPWTVIDTISLTPDDDPSLPAARSFTTENGTAADLWYRITFLDSLGGQTEPTGPMQNILPLGTPYATVDELALLLRVDSVKRRESLERVLAAAAYEIDQEVGNLTPYSNPPPLAVEVNLERAVEHWKQMESPFGLVGLGGVETPGFTAKDTWARHAAKLAPLKLSWGLA